MGVRSRQMYVLAARRGTHADTGNRAGSFPPPSPRSCWPPPGEHTLPECPHAGRATSVPRPASYSTIPVPAQEVEHREETRTSVQAPRPIVAPSPPFALGSCSYLIDPSLPLACVRGRCGPEGCTVCSNRFSRPLRRAGPGGRARPLTACR